MRVGAHGQGGAWDARPFDSRCIIASPWCYGRMEPVAAILQARSLVRVLAHLGLSTDFPKLAPARSPPRLLSEESQVDPKESLFPSIDWIPPDDIPASSQATVEE